MKPRIVSLLVLLAVALAAPGCDLEFDPASEIKTQRFLGIIADPIEAAPGEPITFRAIVANGDGSLYEGPIAWAIIGGDAARLTGDTENVDINDFYLQPSPDLPFEWMVPEIDEFETAFGPLQSNGQILTVGATAFKNGDLESEPVFAYKLFIVSERAEDDRLRNPELLDVEVKAAGNVLSPNEEGRFVTGAKEVKLTAQVDQKDADQTFHWFATTDKFEPDLEDEQTFDPDGTGRFSVYCVVRESFFFVHDDGRRTRVTGQDFWRGDIRFQ
ncbi:MAG: hypothetical protein P9L99_04490 [Candidatus Lernaella stagnicola]|nr:hypothetical protein [Candidatus Lernaella stagnicola]